MWNQRHIRNQSKAGSTAQFLEASCKTPVQVIGKCRLCLKENVKLCRSHFFPAGAFRIIQRETIREGQSKNPNPLWMNIRSLVQSSFQPRANLFCGTCEQRLSTNGESWILKNCWRTGTFPLLSLISAGTPAKTKPEIDIYHADKILAINTSAISYFAASMFWRAAANNWWDEQGQSPIRLGSYFEQLRQYLMGVTDFPKHCALCVVLPNRNVDVAKMVQFMPVARKFAGCHLYILHFLGIQFLLFAGQSFPEHYREMDFVHGKGNPILVTSRFERWFTHDMRSALGTKRLSEIVARMY